MATLSVQNPSAEGATFSMAAADVAGDEFANNGKVALMVTNASGGSITVTFDAPGTCNFDAAANAAHDLAVTVAAGASKLIGPLSTARFNDVDGMVQVAYSAVTDVDVAVIKVRT